MVSRSIHNTTSSNINMLNYMATFAARAINLAMHQVPICEALLVHEMKALVNV